MRPFQLFPSVARISIALLALATLSSAFSPLSQPHGLVSHATTSRIFFGSPSRSFALFSTGESSSSSDEPPVATTEESSSSPLPSSDELTADFPIDVPSPLLLASSMILGITGTGSVFELTGGSPNLGFGPTAAIATVSVPLCFFMFYASIKKAQAETEADDKEFLKRNGGRF